MSVQRNKLNPGSRPSTPSTLGIPPILPGSYASLHPRQPIQTPEQFYDWFALIDRSVAHSQDSHFRAHIANVSEHLETCDVLLERIDTVEKEVDSMSENWRTVEERGRSLKDACERLLAERVCMVLKNIQRHTNLSTRTSYWSLQMGLTRGWITSRSLIMLRGCLTIQESRWSCKQISCTW